MINLLRNTNEIIYSYGELLFHFILLYYGRTVYFMFFNFITQRLKLSIMRLLISCDAVYQSRSISFTGLPTNATTAFLWTDLGTQINLQNGEQSTYGGVLLSQSPGPYPSIYSSSREHVRVVRIREASTKKGAGRSARERRRMHRHQ